MKMNCVTGPMKREQVAGKHGREDSALAQLGFEGR